MLRKLLFILFLIPIGIPVSMRAQTFWQTTVINGLNRPVAFDIAPDGRIFITLKGGITGPATTAQ
ncbi:MAG TPA: hypothetical protein VFJ43_11150, partial [Bacteroidia bacterium]|nr:hypothetical protein [Bacteroidia bacterium]